MMEQLHEHNDLGLLANSVAIVLHMDELKQKKSKAQMRKHLHESHPNSVSTQKRNQENKLKRPSANPSTPVSHSKGPRAEQVYTMLMNLFDAITQGVLVVDNCCVVEFMNNTATHEIASSSSVSISANQKLNFKSKDQNVKFKELVVKMTLGQENQQKIVNIDRSSSSRTMRVQPLPVDSSKVLVSICNRRTLLFDHQLAASTFELSRAEIAVCQALASGDSVKIIAANRGTSPQTVRYQLKSIFAKTQTNNQHGLVSLLLTATAPSIFQLN